jgi:hypothetical protein
VDYVLTRRIIPFGCSLHHRRERGRGSGYLRSSPAYIATSSFFLFKDRGLYRQLLPDQLDFERLQHG